MIKMIRGVFGLPVNGIVVPKDKNSEPFNASEEQEKRLVERGFAEYVDGGEILTPPEGGSLDEMKADDLRAYGKELGLTFRVGMRKVDMISAIREALEKGNDVTNAQTSDDGSQTPEGGSPEDEDDLPNFDASQAVQ